VKERLRANVHLVVLVAGLLNVAVLPLCRFQGARATSRAAGYLLFGLGTTLCLFALVALKQGINGEVEPVTELVAQGIYAVLRHPLYVSFALLMLGLDLLMRSTLGILFTLGLFLPSMHWRAHLEERALARRFGVAWQDYAGRVPSLLLWDLGRSGKRL
jgi:protein-S-isoprenylcysteine O-methyltransferase Ste14